jgi:pimeloyl-ACP methyl ester carboxylesterase
MFSITKKRQLTAGPKATGLQILTLLLLTGLLYACSSNSSSTSSLTPTAAGELVSFNPIVTFDAAQMNQQISAFGLTGIIVSGTVSCYKLSYGTPNVSGKLITASGLVCLPQTKTGGNPVLSYQHGTIFQDSEAPTSFVTSGEAAVGIVLAGLGYITVLPDYVGYGDSTNELHPYVHASTLASATVNMNRAARKFLADPSINRTTNGQFFLTGYSEGGYATLAAQRLMEQNLASEFPITASEPGAGPYDISGTAVSILSSPTLSQPAFAGFLLKAYDSIYNTPSQLRNYFTATYAGIVDTHFDGSFSRSQITGALGGAGVQTNTLFNQTFLTSYGDGGEITLKNHIKENDIYDWAPKVPTRLFHGPNDDTVPFVNSTTAETRMKANGSTTVTVVDTCSVVLDAHTACAKPFALDMIAFFKLASGL